MLGVQAPAHLNERRAPTRDAPSPLRSPSALPHCSGPPRRSTRATRRSKCTTPPGPCWPPSTTRRCSERRCSERRRSERRRSVRSTAARCACAADLRRERPSLRARPLSLTLLPHLDSQLAVPFPFARPLLSQPCASLLPCLAFALQASLPPGPASAPLSSALVGCLQRSLLFQLLAFARSPPCRRAVPALTSLCVVCLNHNLSQASQEIQSVTSAAVLASKGCGSPMGGTRKIKGASEGRDSALNPSGEEEGAQNGEAHARHERHEYRERRRLAAQPQLGLQGGTRRRGGQTCRGRGIERRPAAVKATSAAAAAAAADDGNRRIGGEQAKQTHLQPVDDRIHEGRERGGARQPEGPRHVVAGPHEDAAAERGRRGGRLRDGERIEAAAAVLVARRVQLARRLGVCSRLRRPCHPPPPPSTLPPSLTRS